MRNVHPLPSLTLAVLLASASAAFAAGFMDPRIARQATTKQRLGIATPEQVILYVDAPLSAKELGDWARRGIAIHAAQYVPPVPGRHPRGFYLASVTPVAVPELQAAVRADVFPAALTGETISMPLDDVARIRTNVDPVHAGQAPLPAAYNGAGVKIAVADAGFNAHPDFPPFTEAYDMTDGTDPATWGASVTSPVSEHGTHVGGTVVGSGGLSAGRYIGNAPGAQFHAYKIGNDTNAGASSADMIEAINRAAAVGCRIMNISYGGFEDFMDGSDPKCQAIDAAALGGMATFVAAGNDGNQNRHRMSTIAPSSTSNFFYTVNATGAYTGTETLLLTWQDNAPADLNITLTCTNLAVGETFTEVFSGTSPRNTESVVYELVCHFAAAGSKAYNLTMSNAAVTGSTPLAHVYELGSGVSSSTLSGTTNVYTITSPALADQAICVGAWTHRTSAVNFAGTTWTTPSETLNTLSSFSSRGPRIDGAIYPTIVAPGTRLISLRGPLAVSGTLRMDNDGINDGLGPADYVASQGTSMASPHAAGIGALMVQANPAITVAGIRLGLQLAAEFPATPDSQRGYGVPNAKVAVLEAAGLTVNDWEIRE